jgi:hypothetical protein
MIPASTSEISAPRRRDVAGFLFAGGNRLLSVSIDASQAGGVIGQRLPIRSTGPTRFIGVPSRTAPRVTGSSRHWLDRSPMPGLTIQLAGGDQPVGMALALSALAVRNPTINKGRP